MLARLSAPLWRLVRAHPLKTAVASVLMLAMAGIVGNAVLFQKGRHPAPLFGTAQHPAATSETAAEVPLPAARPEEPAASLPLPPAAVQARSAEAEPARAAAPVSKDGITQLLEGGKPHASAPAEPKVADATVSGAQRALEKLGYDVKPDGHLGATTHQAIAKFQRDRHQPADGALSPKLLHQLGVASTVPHG